MRIFRAVFYTNEACKTRAITQALFFERLSSILFGNDWIETYSLYSEKMPQI